MFAVRVQIPNNYDLIFNIYDNNTIIVSKNKDILYYIKINTDIDKKLLNIINKFIRILDIKKYSNKILIILLLIIWYKNINCKGFTFNNKYKEKLIYNFFLKFNIIKQI